jgi:hypothetical protein
MILGKPVNLSRLHISFFLLVGLGFDEGFTLAKQACYHLSHTFSPFCCGYFGDGVSRTISLGCIQTVTLLISASQVATGTEELHTSSQKVKYDKNQIK